MTTNKHCNYITINKFDPPKEHMSDPLFSPITPMQNAVAKQGAYRKIKTHTKSKLSQLVHLDEVCSAATLLYIKSLKSNLQRWHYLDKQKQQSYSGSCSESSGGGDSSNSESYYYGNGNIGVDAQSTKSISAS
eukprot:4085361-Ditylum_brightwellii.AAC.1